MLLQQPDHSSSGFKILSALRAEFPHVVSLLMDVATITRHRSLAVPGIGRQPSLPPHLTTTELLAFDLCRQESLRIEQERLRLGYERISVTTRPATSVRR